MDMLILQDSSYGEVSGPIINSKLNFKWLCSVIPIVLVKVCSKDLNIEEATNCYVKSSLNY